MALLVGVLSGCVEEKTPEPEPTTNTEPVADFSFLPATPAKDEEVIFTDASSDEDEGTILTYIWDFETDGTIDSTDQNPTYTYTENGTYPITLTVSDGIDTGVKTLDIIVGNIAPSAGFTYEINYLEVNFTDASMDLNGDDLTYSWDFGDETGTSTEQSPVYTYADAGTYNVTLTVTDPYNESDTSDEVEITVEAEATE